MSELKPCQSSVENAITVLENEKQCVLRQIQIGGCDRNCVKCDLVMNDSEILAGYDTAVDALRRAQPANEPCTDCSGIVYRQTNSGKIIPADQRCGAKITPPCYQPDGDGCAYQIYGDNNDEPIERCKACPLCYSDKVRHKDPANEPPVRCGECANYQTQNCAAKHEQALMDFCSHGIRKPGGEQE